MDGHWGSWTESCSITCGSGTSTRSRLCNNPSPQHGGSNCTGDATQSGNCTLEPCPGNGEMQKVVHVLLYCMCKDSEELRIALDFKQI